MSEVAPSQEEATAPLPPPPSSSQTEPHSMEVFARLSDVWIPVFQRLSIRDLFTVSLVCKAWCKHAGEVRWLGPW